MKAAPLLNSNKYPRLRIKNHPQRGRIYKNNKKKTQPKQTSHTVSRKDQSDFCSLFSPFTIVADPKALIGLPTLSNSVVYLIINGILAEVRGT